MDARFGMRCLACGFLYEAAHDRHHCQHCFADSTYLRPLHRPLRHLPPEHRLASPAGA